MATSRDWCARALLGVFLAAQGAAGSAAPVQQTPPSLARVGKDVGCVLPDRALQGTTMWVEERSAGHAYAAWCERRPSTKNRREYDLVIAVSAAGHPWSACPAHLKLGLEKPMPQLATRLLPRELPYPIDLSEFWYATSGYWLVEPTRLQVKGVPAGPALDIGLGDAGHLLLCVGRQWVMGGYH